MDQDDQPMVEVRSRAELRDWLAVHHGQAGSVWLVTWKKGSDRYLSWDEIVEELLCWGWIDSVTRKVDEARTGLRISPRKAGSAWSAVNKGLVARARTSGAMTGAGEAAIARAQANGMWGFLDDVERLEVPPDLAEALHRQGAAEAWEAYPRSVKRGTLEWIKTAKTPPTRARRIADVAGSAADGLRPSPFRR